MLLPYMTLSEYYELDLEQRFISYIKANPEHICFKCERMWEKFYEDGRFNADLRIYSIGFNYCDILNLKKTCSEIEIEQTCITLHFGPDYNEEIRINELLVTKCEDFEEHKGNELYYPYINSPFWQEKRFERMKKDNFKCVLCGTAKNLRVHHITYENLINENTDDLVTLCDNCHKNLHSADLRE